MTTPSRCDGLTSGQRLQDFVWWVLKDGWRHWSRCLRRCDSRNSVARLEAAQRVVCGRVVVVLTRARKRSTTARRWAPSTFPPYLNFALTRSTRTSIPRIPSSFAACASAGSATSTSGWKTRRAGDAGWTPPFPARCARRARRRSPPTAPRRSTWSGCRVRDPPKSMAFQAEGMKAQSPATLSTTAGFSASDGEDRVRPHKMQPHRLTGQHELRRHHDRNQALGPASGDQVPEGMGLDEGAPLRFAERGVDRGDEHRLSLAHSPHAADARRTQLSVERLTRAATPSSSIDSARWRL